MASLGPSPKTTTADPSPLRKAALPPPPPTSRQSLSCAVSFAQTPWERRGGARTNRFQVCPRPLTATAAALRPGKHNTAVHVKDVGPALPRCGLPCEVSCEALWQLPSTLVGYPPTTFCCPPTPRQFTFNRRPLPSNAGSHPETAVGYPPTPVVYPPTLGGFRWIKCNVPLQMPSSVVWRFRREDMPTHDPHVAIPSPSRTHPSNPPVIRMLRTCQPVAHP